VNEADFNSLLMDVRALRHDMTELRQDMTKLRQDVAALADLVRYNPIGRRYVEGYKAAAEYSGFSVWTLKRWVAIGVLGRNGESKTCLKLSVAELDALRKEHWIKAKRKV
jgi:hypothetical protein